jgi:hypothetical protein
MSISKFSEYRNITIKQIKNLSIVVRNKNLNIYVLTNVTNSYNQSSSVNYCIGNIFNVNSLMIITKHPVLHMQFFN